MSEEFRCPEPGPHVPPSEARKLIESEDNPAKRRELLNSLKFADLVALLLRRMISDAEALSLDHLGYEAEALADIIALRDERDALKSQRKEAGT